MVDEGTSSGSGGGHGGRPRVLVVDDEVDLLRAFRRLLPGHDVVTAPGGPDAVALLERDDAFDAIVLDVMMPDLDGTQVYQWLRQHRPALAPRVVFCSGGIFGRAMQDYLRALPNPLLIKPVSSQELLSALAPLTGWSPPA